MAREDRKPPAVDPLTAPLPKSLVDAGPEIAPVSAPVSAPVDPAPPPKVVPAPASAAQSATVKVRLANGAVSCGPYLAGKDYDVDAETAARLFERGFIPVEG